MQFCFIDKVTEIIPGESASGYKNVTANHYQLDAHFPGITLFPGSQQVEAMAQLAGFLIELSMSAQERGNQRAVSVKIEKFKFHRAVKPGDQLCFQVSMVSGFGDAREVKVKASVEDEMAAQGQLTFVLKPVDIAEVHARQDRLYQLWLKDLDPELIHR